MARSACALLLALLAAAPVSALDRIRADRVRSGAVRADEVAIALDGESLRAAAASVAVDGIALEPRALRWQCTPESIPGGWRCAGRVDARIDGKAARATLAFDRADGGHAISLARDRAQVALAMPGDAPARLALRRVPLAWLAPLAKDALPGAVPGGGVIDGALLVTAFDPLAATGQFRLDGAGFDSADGAIAASALDAGVKLALGGDAKARTLALEATIDGGAWLVAPWYVEIGAHPIALSLELESRAGAHMLRSWRWQDAGALVARGTARLGPGGRIAAIEIAEFEAGLARAWPRYAAGPLGGTALGKSDAQGTLRGALAYEPGQPLRGEVALDAVSVRDGEGRFAIEGITGRLPLAPAAPTAAELRWQSAAIHRIAIAGGTVALRAAPGGWSLAAPLTLALLEGHVRIPRLDVVRGGTAGRVEAALELEGISVAALTRALEWPEFGGRLSGQIPSVRSEGERITFEGGLAFEVFDGRIDVGALTLERAFGVAPSLAADLKIDGLDLAALTSAFSFGRIEGRLDGRIAGLRLVDWSPAAFDLLLATDPDYRGRKRISQRAVDSLSTVGGAGAAAGIQRSVLRMFDSFSYSAIGLSCRLRNNVCEMGGLDSENGGYTIVRGAGLPRLTVVGHQRRVDWPVLVARLKAATEGAGPVVE